MVHVSSVFPVFNSCGFFFFLFGHLTAWGLGLATGSSVRYALITHVKLLLDLPMFEIDQMASVGNI